MNLGDNYKKYSDPYCGKYWFLDPKKAAVQYLDQQRHTKDNNSAIIPNVEVGNGVWSKPYFDCGAGDIWMMTYTVGFFGYNRSKQTYFFLGTSGIDINLQKVDINQCPSSQHKDTNHFANTDKCDKNTTRCEQIDGRGFTSGAYKCICQDGFYFPNTSTPAQYFEGTEIEANLKNFKKYGKNSSVVLKSFSCIPCPKHCPECKDGRPCLVENILILRVILLLLNLCVMLCIPLLVFFTIYYEKVKVLKASSPVLLRIILLGAFLLYCPVIINFHEAQPSCSLKIWFREIGFCLSYGGLLLKTWRISVVFRVRSAQRVKITDMDLIKRLACILLVVIIILSIRQAFEPPVWEIDNAKSLYSSSDIKLKAFRCKFTTWDWCMAAGELIFLMWGIRLCLVVRKAPSEFNESRFISWAIYNETLLSIFVNVITIFLQNPAIPDLAYIVLFIHTQMTTTVTLSFLFGTKAYLVYKNGGQSEHSADGANKPRHAGTMRFAGGQKSDMIRGKASIADGTAGPNNLLDAFDDDEHSAIDKTLLVGLIIGKSIVYWNRSLAH